MRIGCDMLHYAKMTTEDTASTAPVYGTVTPAPGVMHVNINPNASLATAFFDDGPGDTASTLGNITVEIQKNFLSANNKADLLGHTLDAAGGVAYADDDTPPFVAIGFRSLKSNGKYRHIWLYKGRFADPEDNSETKGDNINFQADTIVGQFLKLNYPHTVGGKQKRLWKYELDADTPGASQPVIDDWFTEVTFPSSTAPTLVPELSVTFEAGIGSGSTSAIISGSAGLGNHFAVKTSSSALGMPALGALVTGATTYESGDDIPGVSANDYVAIYELTNENKAVKCKVYQLDSGDIAE